MSILPANIQKYIFQNSPNVHIFSKFFKRWNAKRTCRDGNDISVYIDIFFDIRCNKFTLFHFFPEKKNDY